MPSFSDFTIDFNPLLIRIVKTKVFCICFEPVIIFIRFHEIKRICSAGFADDLEIDCQSCLMFARTCLSASRSSASLLDQRILERSASICTRNIQSVSAKGIPEMPGHISKMQGSFLSELKRLRIICRKIGIDIYNISRDIIDIRKRTIRTQISLERTIIIDIKIRSTMNKFRNKLITKRFLDTSGRYSSSDSDTR